MKIEKQVRDDHQAKLTVEVEAEKLEEMKRRAASQIARKVKIPGFRPGKAPYAVIVRQVGEAAILEEAIELLVDEIYPEVLKEAQIKPYGPGQLENVASMDPLTLEFLVPLEAEVVLGDYRSIRKDYEPTQVSEQDVQKVLESLRERQAIIEPVERPVQAGDVVTARLSARRLNVKEGEDETVLREQSFPILVRDAEHAEDDSDDERAVERPFPGFSKHLIGATPGDEIIITHTYPDDYDEEDLRGADVEYRLVVENVKARTLPELDDELAKSLGEFENLEALVQQIRQNLEEEALDEYHEVYDAEVIDQVIEQATIKYPPQMLEREIDSLIHDLGHRLERQGLDLELYMKVRKLDQEGLRKEIEPVAEKRLKRSLVLMKLGEAEKIEVPPEELERESINAMNQLYGSLPEKEARKLLKQEVYTTVISNVLVDMMIERTTSRLRDIASGKAGSEADQTREAEPPADAEVNPAGDVQSPPVVEAESLPVQAPADTDASEISDAA